MPTRVNAFGDPHAPICVVGEAPGKDEDFRGVPFVGKSGLLQDKFMNRVNLIRGKDVYLTNCFKERPPDNDVRKFIIIDARKGTARLTPEGEVYRQELIQELKGVTSNVVVAAGATALYILTGHFGITKWRGSILTALAEYNGRKVISTLHPAAILRAYGKTSGSFTHTYMMDWGRIKEDSTFPELRLPQRTLRIHNTYYEIMEYIERCRQLQDRIGFDIESTRSKISKWEMSHFSLALSATDAMCVSLIDVSEGIVHDVFSARDELNIIRALASLTEDKKVRKVGQNLIFDGYFIYRKYGIVLQNFDDTRVAHKSAYPEMPASLAYMTSIYTREPFYKDEGKQHKASHIYHSFKEYAAKDAAICVEIIPRILKVVGRLGNDHVYNARLKAHQMLVYAQERGIRTNVNGIRRLKEIYTKRVKAGTAELEQMCGMPVNPNSPDDVKAYFYDKLGLKPYKDRKTGRATVKEEALKRLSRQGYTEAAQVLKLRRMRKFVGTYLNTKLRDDRFAGALDPVGTKLGRMSGKKNSFGEGTNPQNLPPAFKRVFQPDPGYIFLEIDASQAENRVVAFVGNIWEMMDAFNRGIDVHKLTASLIYEKPIEEITKEERQDGKRGNHAFNYGYSAESFSLKYEMPIERARRIQRGYLKAYPGITQYWRWVEQELRTGSTLTNCFGQTIFFMGNRTQDLFRSAYSANPQSTVADYILHRGICFFIDNAHLFPGFEPQNQVHDALWFQIRKAIGAAKLLTMLKVMQAEYNKPIHWKQTKFVIPAEFKFGYSYGRMKVVDINAPNALQLLEEVLA